MMMNIIKQGGKLTLHANLLVDVAKHSPHEMGRNLYLVCVSWATRTHTQVSIPAFELVISSPGFDSKAASLQGRLDHGLAVVT